MGSNPTLSANYSWGTGLGRRNVLLHRLSAEDLARLEPYLERIFLQPGAELAKAGAPMGRTIVSILIHPVERRTARWILLYQDRVGGDEVAMTHEELGLTLGVRRASITDALHCLEGERAITSARDRVIVRDRAKLEALAAETYGHAEAEYRRLLRI